MRNLAGYVNIYRKILEWEWYDDAYMVKFFLTIIILADHKIQRYKNRTIRRGTFVASVSSLSRDARMSETSVKRCLSQLSQTGEIEQEVIPNKFRIITVKNYCKYQDVGSPKTDSKTNSKTDNKTNKKTNSKTNYKTTDKKEKKCVCLTDTHTQEKSASAPRALEERGHAAVTWNEIRQFQIDNRIGSGEMVESFFYAFKNSGTRIPEDWRDLYTKYARAGYEAQKKFRLNLHAGNYIDKWGAADG